MVDPLTAAIALALTAATASLLLVAAIAYLNWSKE